MGFFVHDERPRIRIIDVLFGVLTWTCLMAGPVTAQLSPGDLSSPHSHLEGLRKCNTCHKLGDRNVGPKCLDCHGQLAARMNTDQGLHAGDKYDSCPACHVEHQGKEADLIYWPDGIGGFNHADTGTVLQGRHQHLKCRECHRAELLVDSASLLAVGKDLNRTYFGLSTECVDCHTDVHQAQLPGACSKCHSQESWRPTPGFSHDTTAYPLTGRHRDIACAKCHEPLDATQPIPGAARFTGLPHMACIDCHRDPHAGRLGPGCTDCHSTDGWRTGQAADFHHERTQYPLLGRHRAVRCEQCHGPDNVRPAFAQCTDCHKDEHGGQSAQRPRLTRCEDCHDVQGFRPARFPLDRHLTGSYPLSGSHLATPCDACHRAGNDPTTPFDLVLDHQDCTACHADPHGPASKPELRTCTVCHDDRSWHDTAFDHASAGYPFEGAHRRAACMACHQQDKATIPVFTTTPTSCAECHTDIHLGQFAVAGDSTVSCDRCHVTVDWFAERFDHDQHSRFPLRGGHEGVACERCHQPLQGPGAKSLVFLPVETDCVACHQVVPAPSGGAR